MRQCVKATLKTVKHRPRFNYFYYLCSVIVIIMTNTLLNIHHND